MADTPRTLAAMIAAMPNNTSGAITEQVLRDLAVSVMTGFLLADAPSYGDEAAAIAGGVPSKYMYRNGNFVMVRAT